MSREINDLFEDSLDQAMREGRHTADLWRQEAGNIDAAHLLCSCGEAFKEKLLIDLLIASSHSFDNFMLYLNPEEFGESRSDVIWERAKVRKEHPSVLLLEYITTTTNRIFTIKDIIDGLEFANLFRVIAGFVRHKSMQELKEHASSSRHTVCCKARSRVLLVDRGSSRINTFGLPFRTSRSHKNKGVVKGYHGIVLLTFLNDGRDHAMQVKNILENQGNNKPSYIVFTLSNFSQYIVENFMKHIVWVMSQVDFIVPILTKEYFKMLEEDREMHGSGLDEKYAPYIKELLLVEWASNFRNKRIRSFKPKDVKVPDKFNYPPFLTCVDDPSDLPSILKQVK